MAITFVDFHAAASTAAGVISTWPAGILPGDFAILFHLCKYPPSVPAPSAGGGSSWSAPANNQVTGGAGAAGADSGNVTATIFTKTITSELAGGFFATTTTPTPNTQIVILAIYRGSTGAWLSALANGADNSAGTPHSAVMGSDPGIVPNDMIVAFSGVNADAPTRTAEAIAATGLTFGAMTERFDGGNGGGDDVGFWFTDHPVTAGISSGVATYTATHSAGTPAGATIIVRLRELAPFTGAAAITLDSLIVAGEGTQTIEGAAAITLGALTVAGVGAFPLAGAGAITFDDLTVAGTGVQTEPEPEEAVVIRVPGGDLALRWIGGAMDMAMDGDDVAADDGLQTAVLLSLFTDRRAEDDDPTPAEDRAGEGDRRGWWGDKFNQVEGDKIGSRLWLLDRSKRTEDVPRRAEELVREALAWMIEDRVTNRIDVTAMTSDAALLIAVTLYRPQGDPVTFRFKHVWDGELLPDAEPGAVPGDLYFRWDAGEGWDEGVWI